MNYYMLLFGFVAGFVAGQPEPFKLGHLSGSALWDHYYFDLNGRHRVLLDTGSAATWMVSDRALLGGFSTGRNPHVYACQESLHYGVSGAATHGLQGSRCLETVVSLGNHFSWKTKLVMSDRPVTWWHAQGIVGGSPESDFVKAFHSFTLVPKKGFHELHVGRYQPKRKCNHVPLVSRSAWMISGQVQIGSAVLKTNFVVDTGFPAGSVPHQLWDQALLEVQRKGGVLTGRRTGPYGHVIANCNKSTLPVIVYEFSGCHGTTRVELPGAEFSEFRTDGSCVVHVIPHGPDDHSFLGVPFLKHITTRFSARHNRIGFCT